MLDGRNIWELVTKRAAESPDVAMTIDDAGVEMTYAEYRDAAERAAAGLSADHGIGAGDVVTWMLPTWHSSLVLIAALCRLGAVQNPIIPIYRDREVGFITAQARSKLLIVPGEWRGFDYVAMGERVREANGSDLAILTAAPDLPEGDPATLPAAPEPPATRSDEPVTWLMYTSGTTSDPKGAQHSDGDIIVTARGMCDCLGCVEGDRNLMAFPVTHIAGAIWLCSSLMYPLSNVITEGFDPHLTPLLASRTDVTMAGSATFFHMAYLAAQREHGDEKLFPHLRNCPGGGAPKPPQLHYDIQAELGGQGIISGWGLTEAPILTMGHVQDPDEKLANTEGRPMPGVQLRAVSPADGRVVGANEEGELQAKAPQLMRGYLDEALNADGYADGWFRTGDLGVIDEQGYVRITGRLKDVIIRKGENVSAKEVEDLLYEHERVRDVAVIGVPDSERGEMVVAVLALEKEAVPLSMEEMQEFLRGKGLRNQALPERLEHVDELPRNASGKIVKNELRDRYSD